MKIPRWFWVFLFIGAFASFSLLGLVVWALIEVVPALVGWLEVNGG